MCLTLSWAKCVSTYRWQVAFGVPTRSVRAFIGNTRTPRLDVSDKWKFVNGPNQKAINNSGRHPPVKTGCFIARARRSVERAAGATWPEANHFPILQLTTINRDYVGILSSDYWSKSRPQPVWAANVGGDIRQGVGWTSSLIGGWLKPSHGGSVSKISVWGYTGRRGGCCGRDTKFLGVFTWIIGQIKAADENLGTKWNNIFYWIWRYTQILVICFTNPLDSRSSVQEDSLNNMTKSCVYLHSQDVSPRGFSRDN